MEPELKDYGAKRMYRVTKVEADQYLCRLVDREVTLPQSTYTKYNKLVSQLSRKGAENELKDLEWKRLLQSLTKTGLIYRRSEVPETVSGVTFHDEYFTPVLKAWLYKAFSHPFWDAMMTGKGSARLYAGWLFELFHFTKNANRHMPLAAANCNEKKVKTLLARHYHEEWNHYHFFMRALQALGYTKSQVEDSRALPMTMEMSNFMRQAARRDHLAYAICSAVLEGTTVDKTSFNPFYEEVQRLYGVPKEAVKPIYDHLDLDTQYQHSNLFRDICVEAGELDADRASLVLSFGHQMVEHIWMWTENIGRYYGNTNNPVPNLRFDYYRD